MLVLRDASPILRNASQNQKLTDGGVRQPWHKGPFSIVVEVFLKLGCGSSRIAVGALFSKYYLDNHRGCAQACRLWWQYVHRHHDLLRTSFLRRPGATGLDQAGISPRCVYLKIMPYC